MSTPCPENSPMELFERCSIKTEKPPGPKRTVFVPVAVPPEGMNGLGSNFSSVLQVPTRSRSSFISGAGLGIAMPAAPVGGIAFFLDADLS